LTAGVGEVAGVDHGYHDPCEGESVEWVHTTTQPQGSTPGEYDGSSTYDGWAGTSKQGEGQHEQSKPDGPLAQVLSAEAEQDANECAEYHQVLT
jgi:hypothetical protein